MELRFLLFEVFTWICEACLDFGPETVMEESERVMKTSDCMNTLGFHETGNKRRCSL